MLRQRLQATVDQHQVVLFMKGNKLFPQCGFSAQVVQVLRQLGTEFEAVNVLTDPEIRQGIKDFSSWPTIPQLYVNGRFVGGCDIVMQMHETGELQTLISSG